ncbi:hypothetical protein J7E25_03120 [Agromyces sp. ISL-38]|uniref:hypothetical protein n=1 Tax=Agromyces sp. ISL-38 TaxID=2819107 RepID=UPI001BE73BA2|nr:hypothetical protein [Agromyces sp. ISL-38]MBT2498079.1 hypothetical protein [Agromyces sp. ISL-38]
MRLPLNASQLAVLGWIRDGCPPESIPVPTYKQSANTLRDRGLIELDRRRGRWRAEIVDDGRYCLEHGAYPPDPSTIGRKATKAPSHLQDPAPDRRDTPSHPINDAPTPPPVGSPPARDASPGEVALATELRSPHPAVKAIIDDQGRLDVPKELRRRALLLLHSIVREAIRRGWTVESATRPSSDLATINAGHQPVGIRLKGPQKRVPHVKTAKEIADDKRWSHSWAPRYDYLPTDRLRLELRPGNYSGTNVEDSIRTQVERKLDQVFALIQKASDDQRKRETEWRRRQLEQAQAQQIAAERSARGQAYGTWVNSLDELHAAWQRYASLRQLLVDARSELRTVEDEARRESLTQFLAWAEVHLEIDHPLTAMNLPNGEPVLGDYQDWIWTQRKATPQNVWQAFTGGLQ